MMVALAIPPPSHIVWRPYRPPVRSSSLSSVVMSLAPEHPSGCPRAMAPPLTFTLAMSGWCSFSQASTTEANASLISTRSMSDSDILARSSTLSVAGIGPVSIITGSTPARAKVWNRARGLKPSSAAFSSLMISRAAAPSLIWEELPAVTFPSGLKAGFSVASFSTLESGRTPSSRSKTPPSAPVTGRISFSKRPSSMARAAVEGLLADLHDAAHDHVLDESGIEVVAGDEGLERLGGEIDRVPVLQLPVPAADGRPDGVDDDGVRHVVTPVVLDRSVKKQS